MEPKWDSDTNKVPSDDARTARYRQHQSWYREKRLGIPPGEYQDRNGRVRQLGSLLPAEVFERRSGENFLDDTIAAYVAERAEVVIAEGGTLEETRLYTNMLSSMPMCFNLFGKVRSLEATGLAFVRTLFDEAATEVEMIECEWTPRLPASSIGDRTAFDAAIVTRRPDGTRHLVAVETKYTEPFSRTRYGARDHDAGRYQRVHDESGWFVDGSYDDMTASSTNQLWRNCLLAATAVRSGEFDSADVVVVALADDPGARKAIAGVTAKMVDPSRCSAVPLEDIVEASAGLPELASWAERFQERYLPHG